VGKADAVIAFGTLTVKESPMGMDPVKPGELCEVTIVLEGPVGGKALASFRTAIDKAINDANQIPDPDHGNAKLRVRLTRLIVR
jgi:hypothetical protein